MKPQKQVCSLELSKKLKELGVKQESLWYWGLFVRNDGQPNRWELSDRNILNIQNISILKEKCSAFTVAELGEVLPESILTIRPYQKNEWDYKPKDKWQCSICGKNGYCCMSDGFIDTNLTTEMTNTEADARAKMLIYLIENKLVDVKKL